MSKEKEYPSIPQQAKNLSKTAFDIVSGIFRGDHEIMVSEETKAKREEICKGCEYYDPVDGGRCKECGCFLQNKYPWTLAKCNIGKWNQDEQSFIDYFEKLDKEEKED
jgi:hypothetical protein